MKSLILPISAAGLAFFAGRFSNQPQYPTCQADQVPIASSATQTADVNELQSLRTELSLLNANILQLETKNNDLRVQLAAQVAASSKIDATNSDLTTVVAAANALADAREFTQKLLASPNNFYQRLEADFARESVDYEWANLQQQELQQHLKNTHTHSLDAQDILCKSTQCKIRFNVQSNDQANQFVQLFTQQLSGIKGVSRSQVLSRYDIARATLDIYLRKDTSDLSAN